MSESLDFINSSLGFSTQGSFLILVKVVYLIGLMIYLAFGVIVVRQVGLLTKTLHGEFESVLKLVAWFHLVVALGVFILALIWL